MPNSVSSPPAPATAHAGDERVELLRCLLADRHWRTEEPARTRLLAILARLRGEPGARLDEAAWTLLADETAAYLDFRRRSGIEAQLRGCTREALGFTRADWERCRAAEAALDAHRRHVREASYVPVPAPLFRIH